VISWLSVLPVLTLTLQISLAPAPAAQAQPVADALSSTEAGLAVEAFDPLDPKAQPQSALEPEDFTVLEDGAPRRVLAAEAGKPWRVVIYVDRILAGTRSVRGAAGLLAAQARELTALGPVDLVIAEPEPRLALLSTRDPLVLDESLSRLLLMADGRDDLRALRQRFLDEVGAPTEAPEDLSDDLADRVEEAVAAETRLVGRQQDALLEWLAGEAREDGPRVLFLVTDGFDLDPRSPYLERIADPARRSAIEAGLAEPLLAARTSELARTAAALGWTVLPMPVGNERLPDLGRLGTRSTEQVPIGVVIRPGRRKPKEEPAMPELPPLREPRAPLVTLAAETGGEILTDASTAAATITRLRSRLWLRYEVPAATDGRLRAVEVRKADSGERAKAARWSGPPVPEAMATLRARRLLDGEEDLGDLAVPAVLRRTDDPSGAVSWVLEVRPEEPSVRRITLAVPSATGEGMTQRVLTPAELAEDGAWRFPVTLPAGAERVAVVLDDLQSDVWGGRLLEVPLERVAEEAEDDEPFVEEAPTRPRSWSGRGIRIVSPSGSRAVGPVDVEVDVRLPEGRRLEKLELFWNDELSATLYDAPYRQRLTIPRDRSVGYLRASARLDDGTTAEDAVLLNSTAAGERLDVRLVELYVVVTDRDGRPVRGLGRDDFRLLQDGREQAIAGFDDAGELPLSLGLAFDSSASMFLKLPDVREAARTLISGGLSRRDRALLVDFDTEPRLVTGMTGDLGAVSAGLDSLRADGNSDLFEAIVFALQQLRGADGRKALVVYSDGIGEGEQTSYRACLREARRANVPVYLIVTNYRAARAAAPGSGESLDSYAERLDRLAAATGGRAFFVMPSQNPGEIYAEILRELRSQYLLTYYPREATQEVWRKVDVEVKKRGFLARTLSGFYARKDG
jgi:Ca-activated chloride channel family protein